MDPKERKVWVWNLARRETFLAIIPHRQMIDMNSFKISSMFAYIPLILCFLIKKTNICVYTQTELIVTCILHFTIDSQIVKKVGNVRFVIG